MADQVAVLREPLASSKRSGPIRVVSEYDNHGKPLSGATRRDIRHRRTEGVPPPGHAIVVAGVSNSIVKCLNRSRGFQNDCNLHVAKCAALRAMRRYQGRTLVSGERVDGCTFSPSASSAASRLIGLCDVRAVGFKQRGVHPFGPAHWIAGRQGCRSTFSPVRSIRPPVRTGSDQPRATVSR